MVAKKLDKWKFGLFVILIGGFFFMVIPFGKADVSIANQFIEIILQAGQTQDPFMIKNATGSTLVKIDANGAVFSQSINATNITAKNIGGAVYADQYATIEDAFDALTQRRTWQETVIYRGNITYDNSVSPLIIPNNTIFELRGKITANDYTKTLIYTGNNVILDGGIYDGNSGGLYGGDIPVRVIHSEGNSNTSFSNLQIRNGYGRGIEIDNPQGVIVDNVIAAANHRNIMLWSSNSSVLSRVLC